MFKAGELKPEELTRVALRLFDARPLSEVELLDEFTCALPEAIELLQMAADGIERENSEAV
jgi:hypothetical protein